MNPGLLLDLTGSSLIVASFQALFTAGFPVSPNCTTNPSTKRKKARAVVKMMFHEIVEPVRAVRSPRTRHMNHEIALRGDEFHVVFGRRLCLSVSPECSRAGSVPVCLSCRRHALRRGRLRAGFGPLPATTRNSNAKCNATTQIPEQSFQSLHGCPPIRFEVASTCSITRSVLPPRIF